MNGTSARFLRLGVSLSGLVVLGWVLTGQAAKPVERGIPLATDWTHSRVIFSRPVHGGTTRSRERRPALSAADLPPRAGASDAFRRG